MLSYSPSQDGSDLLGQLQYKQYCSTLTDIMPCAGYIIYCMFSPIGHRTQTNQITKHWQKHLVCNTEDIRVNSNSPSCPTVWSVQQNISVFFFKVYLKMTFLNHRGICSIKENGTHPPFLQNLTGHTMNLQAFLLDKWVATLFPYTDGAMDKRKLEPHVTLTPTSHLWNVNLISTSKFLQVAWSRKWSCISDTSGKVVWSWLFE